MDFKNYVISEAKDALAVLKFDKAKMAQIAAKPDATRNGIIILVVPAILNVFFASIGLPSGFSAIFSKLTTWPFLIPVLSFVGMAFGISFVARKYFHGVGHDIGFFRVLSYASIVSWVAIPVALLSMIGMVNLFDLFILINLAVVVLVAAVSYHLLLDYHKVKKDDAIKIIVIGVVGYFVIQWILGKIFVGNVYRYF
ncbi:YIP1 family protein [Candidatus Gracilibacteria bacterium]|jgi:hypothetical protein|nr:YIP1 family protein [Candidatus Gracilibacteria bacterium]